MNYLVSISLRNLLRQKRRNILLGSAMAIGVAILCTASSFSHGVSDIMFNKLVRYVAGHVNISIYETKKYITVFRDKDRLDKIIKDSAGKELISTDESIGVFVRALGKGESQNMMIIGIETGKKVSKEQQKEYDESFPLIRGSWDDLRKTDIENPVILSEEKAKALNVSLKDTIAVRFQNLHGQSQSSHLTVAGIMTTGNIFMQGVMFVDAKFAKEIIGYRPYETAAIQLTVKDPQKNAPIIADRIQKALSNPGSAFLTGTLKGKSTAHATILPFMGNEDEKKELMQKNFKLIAGKKDDVYIKDGVMISDALAKKIGAAVDKKVSLTYQPKFGGKDVTFEFTITGIFKSDKIKGEDTVYMHEYLFYKQFNSDIPDLTKDANTAFVPKNDAPFSKALGKEWVLLDRSHSTDELKKKQTETNKKRIKAPVIDVNSMYEMASDVLKLEGVLNLITFVAVLVLFFIILIGVVNTLRMTIRERTREIGTIRAIGMQKSDVTKIFILETGFLALFSAISGAVLSFIIMGAISLIPIKLADNPLGMILVKEHIYFLPNAGSIIWNIIFIVILAVATAYLPARRAAKMSASEALRHYE
jgi:ABC-type lipoprotein release transport system permease subunit